MHFSSKRSRFIDCAGMDLSARRAGGMLSAREVRSQEIEVVCKGVRKLDAGHEVTRNDKAGSERRSVGDILQSGQLFLIQLFAVFSAAKFTGRVLKDVETTVAEEPKIQVLDKASLEVKRENESLAGGIYE